MRHSPLTHARRGVNNASMSASHDGHGERAGGVRRLVALLAISASTIVRMGCPVPDEMPDRAANVSGTVVASAHEPGAPANSHGSEHANGSEQRHDEDTCCQILSHSHAIIGAIALSSEAKAAVLSFAPAIVLTTPLAAAAGPVVKLTPFSNGPPRSFYQRFATFWSHAPPTELT